MRILLPAVIVLAACGGPSLAESDPTGYKACQVLVTMNKSTDTDVRLNGILEAGRYAADAGSPDIRAAANPLIEDFVSVDANLLETACEAHGVEIPVRAPLADSSS